MLSINCNSRTTSEVLLVDVATSHLTPFLVQRRQLGLLYHVEHWRGRLIILASTGPGQEYQVMSTQCLVLLNHFHNVQLKPSLTEDLLSLLPMYLLYLTNIWSAGFSLKRRDCTSVCTPGGAGTSLQALHGLVGALVYSRTWHHHQRLGRSWRSLCPGCKNTGWSLHLDCLPTGQSWASSHCPGQFNKNFFLLRLLLTCFLTCYWWSLLLMTFL